MPLRLLGDIIGAVATGKQNKRSQQFAVDRYNVERKDSLDFWRQQNEYNSPQAQMMRLQEAGLNKNLIFGLGSSGNAGQIDTPDTQSAQFRTPDFGGLQKTNLINEIADVRVKQAQVDNLKKQNNVLFWEAMVKASEVAVKNSGAVGNRIRNTILDDTLKYSAEKAEEEQRQLMQKGKIQDETYKQSLSSTDIKNLEASLAKVGIFRGSNIFNSIMSLLASQITKIKK